MKAEISSLERFCEVGESFPPVMEIRSICLMSEAWILDKYCSGIFEKEAGKIFKNSSGYFLHGRSLLSYYEGEVSLSVAFFVFPELFTTVRAAGRNQKITSGKSYASNLLFYT